MSDRTGRSPCSEVSTLTHRIGAAVRLMAAALVACLAVSPASAAGLDVIAIGDNAGRVYSMVSSGDGTFGPLTELLDTGSNTRGAVVGDFDEDGDLDIISGNGDSSTITPFFFAGNGDGTFAAGVELPSSSGSSGYFMGAATADFNEDGHLDFVVNGNSGSVAFYWGAGDGTFTQEVRSFPSSGRDMDDGDFDEDGHLDLVRATYSNGYIRLYLGDGAGGFTEAAAIVGDAGTDPYGVAAGDFDCDGHLDVLGHYGSNGAITLFRGRGDGTFLPGESRPELDVNNYGAMDAFDVNRDGRLDLVLTNYSSRYIYYFAGNGDGTFASGVQLSQRPPSASLGLAGPRLPPRIDLAIDASAESMALGSPLTLAAVGSDVNASDGFEWDFGDGTTASGMVVTHSYSQEDVMTVSLLHTAADGVKRCLRTFVRAEGETPVARPGGPYELGEEAADQATWTASLDGSASTDDFGIASYEWDYGDGQSGSGATVQHTWSGVGPWTVTLTVTDGSGLSASAQTTVTFTPGAAPVAVITGPDVIDETAATAGEWQATFSAGSSSDDVRIWKYDWNFGTGATATGASGLATYRFEGNYTVQLVVTDHAGQATTVTKPLTVVANDPPIAAIAGPSVVGEGSATGGAWRSMWDASGSTDDTGIYRYQWDFGDGTGVVEGETVSHDHTATGTYTVVLTVTDNGNQTATTSRTVDVVAGDPPVAGIGLSRTVVEGAQPLVISGAPSTDDFGIWRYIWQVPPQIYGFDGTVIDDEVWQTSGTNVTQNDRLIVTNSSGWNRAYFFHRGDAFQRGFALEARVDTSTGTSYMAIGAKDRNLTTGYYANLLHAIYFQNGNIDIVEGGSTRQNNIRAYSRGTSYDIRIETLPGQGARYYWRPSGAGQPFEFLWESPYRTDAEFSVGADVYSGTFGIDDIRIEAILDGEENTISTVGGELRLTVVDNALQEDTTTASVSSVTGQPPLAVLNGPTEASPGVDLQFDARGSSDDYEVASYEWDFGDGGTSSGLEARHFYSSPGTYTVTLTVRDFAGQSAVATQQVSILGQGLVTTVPWKLLGDIEIPHETWSGNEAVLKAAAPYAALPLDYEWDLGDGSAPVTGTAATLEEAYAIEARHVYVGSEGTPFEATVTITDADGNSASDTYPLIIRAKSIEVEINVAIDDGLWYLHRTQTRTSIDATTRGGYWAEGGYQSGPTSSAVQAFATNGHTEDRDGARDPYVETVSRGMNHLMTKLRHVNIGPQTYGDPDPNGNGIGLEVNDGLPPYQGGQVMDAIISGGRPDLVARAGGANVKGRPYGDIIQDMADQYGWGQYDHATVGGGWRYSWNSGPDNSACQWGAIGMIPAESIFGTTVPQWVKERNEVWCDYSQNASDGRFGYTSGGGCVDACYGTTPSGMVQLAWLGIPTSDPRWRRAEDWIADRWSAYVSRNNFYAYFAIAKAMRVAQPAPLSKFRKSGKEWFLDPVDGLARILVDRQDQSDGSWRSNQWISSRPYASAWGIIILTSTLFQQGPVAVASVRPNPAAVGQEIRFDATGSFHQDPTFQVVEYRWDFDNSDGVDFDTPDAVGPVVTHTYGELRTFTATLQVKDNNPQPLFDTASLEVRVTIPPHPPTANAGGPYLAAVGEDIVLDGSGSFDIDLADGDSIQSWDWEVDFEQPLDFDDDVTGESATFLGGFSSPGTKNIGLRVTDRTASIFPQAGEPDLTDDDFTTAIIYNKVIDDLAARPKETKIQLTWTYRGDGTPWTVEVWRSEAGPNRGFEKIAVTQSTYATYLDQGLPLNKRFFYRLLVYVPSGDDLTLIGSSCAVTAQTARRSRDRNRIPRIVSSPPTEASVGSLYRYDVVATDADREPLTYVLGAGPTGMAIDDTSGRLEFTPVASQLGLHDVFIEVRDPRGGAATQLYQIVVRPEPNDPPTAEAGGPYGAVRGQSITFSSAGSADPDGDPLTYTWNFGDGTTSTDPSPIHTYTATGNYVATLIVADGRGGTASDQATVQIDDPNRPPVAQVVDGPDFSIRLGQVLTLDGSTSFDLDGHALAYTWSWGDSTPGDTGPTASHTYGDEGSYQGALTVDDGHGGQDTYEFLVTVGSPNTPPVASFEITEAGVNPGDQWAFDASATFDPDGDPLSYSWDFGDGSSTSGTVVTHVFQTAGDFTVMLTVSDPFDGSDSASAAVHVNAAPEFLSSPPLEVSQDAFWLYTVDVLDADGDPVTVTVETAPSTLSYDPSSGELAWNPGNEDVGTHPVLIRAADDLGGETEQSFSIEVIDLNDPPQITSAPVTTATEEILYQYPVVAEDVDDSDLTWSLDQGPAAMSIDGNGLITWTPQGLDTGDHPVAVSVSDPRGGSDSQSFTLTVLDVNDAPIISSSPGVSATEGVEYAYDVVATDEDDSSLQYSLPQAPTGMSIDGSGRIRWVPEVGGVSEAVSVLVTDGRGGEATQSFSVSVTNVNDAPEFTTSPGLVAVALQPYAYDANATDEESDPITFGLVSGPTGLTVDPSTGLVEWEPTDGDVGTAAVTIQASDGQGGITPQSWVIEVRERNRPPEITSTPPTVALEDELYSYQAVADDPDGNPLTWSLDAAPAGLTVDPGTGLVEWTPSAADVGDHGVTLRVEDDLGESATQSWTIGVAEVNDAPEITSAPVTVAEPGFPYAYDVEASDEENDPLTFALDASPAGMSIDPSTGLITWSPTGSQLGDRSVTVRVTDDPGKSATQTFTVTVVDLPHPPVVSGIPGQVVLVGRAFAPIDLSAFVDDLDHDDGDIDWQVTGASELQVAVDASGVATITYSGSDPIAEDLTFTATDPDGLSDAATSRFTVTDDTSAIVDSVIIDLEDPVLLEGGSVSLSVTGVYGNGTSADLTSGATFSSDDESVATVSPEGVLVAVGPGTTTIRATYDGVTGVVTVTVAEVVSDSTPPTAAISSPANGTELAAAVDIVGTATDDNFLKYVLDFAPAGSGDFTTLRVGTSPVAGGVLGTFDPTLLLNGLYTVRVTVHDQGGNTASAQSTYQAVGEQKVGNFTVTFKDLEIGVSGVPIRIERTYDSRARSKGDFGFGWRLGIQTLKVEVNRTLGTGWYVSKGGGFLPSYYLQATDLHRVSITLGNGRVEAFELKFSPDQQTLFPLQTVNPYFEAVTGTQGSLVPLGGSDAWILDPQPGHVEIIDFNTFLPYDPQSFLYTSPDGTSFVINRQSGVTQITQPNGERLFISPSGISHSGGKSIAFSRDAQSRITSITDPRGNVHAYGYDGNGDLESYTDPLGNVTRYLYNRSHGLLETIDPRGVRAVRNEYDDDGRLVATVDAAGNRFEFDFDVAGRRQVLTDRLGNVTVLVYDDSGNVVSETDALGNTTTRTFDADGNQLTETDPLGNTTTFSYDASGDLLTETDPLGNTTTFTRNARGAPLTETDPLGRVTSYTYDASGNRLTVTDPLGHSIANTYDSSGNPLTLSDQLGNTISNTFDGSGNQTGAEDEKGTVFSKTYDANNNLLTESTTVPDGAGGTMTISVQREYDALDRLVRLTDTSGEVSTFTYNAIGDVETQTDPLGNVTRYEYDDLGRRTRTVLPDGTSEAVAYDAEGRIVSRTNRAGGTTSMTYDAVGRLIEETYPDGSSTSTEYDAAGRKVAEVDELGNRTEYTYDAAGRNTSKTDPLGGVTTFAYDAAGNLVSRTDPRGNATSYVYDGNDRIVRIDYPDGTSTSTTYDAAGNKATETDAAGNTTSFEYDATGKLVRVVDALGGETTYTWDALRQLTSQTDANGNTTEFEYNCCVGRVTDRILPLGERETRTYDSAKRLVAIEDPDGNVQARTLDESGRPVRVTLPGGVTIDTTYTATGKIDSITDARGTTSFSYDARDRVTSVTDPDGEIIRYTYDLAGNRTSVETSGGTSLYTYDANGRITSVTDPDGQATTFAYDAVGNRASMAQPNGVVHDYTYDSMNRLTRIEISRGGTTLESYDYTLGPAGNRTRVVEGSGRTVDYTYDALFRLVREDITDPVAGSSSVDYTYDAVGNRTALTTSSGVTTYTYDADNRLVESTDPTGTISSYTYDGHGNLTSTDVGGSLSTYEYDALGRMIRTTAPSGDATSYTYDAFGNRVEKVDASGTTRYIVDPFGAGELSQVLRETDGLGNPLVDYVYAGSQLISMETGSGWSFFGHDGQMSTRLLTDASGAVTDTFDYSAFGELLASTGTTPVLYLYNGQQLDPNTGFYYLRARYYSPETGRFTSPDPVTGTIWDPQTLHPFIYAKLNPVDRSDPSGRYSLVSISISIAIVGVLAAIGGYIGYKFTGTASGAAWGAAGGALVGIAIILRNPKLLTNVLANALLNAVFEWFGQVVAEEYFDIPAPAPPKDREAIVQAFVAGAATGYLATFVTGGCFATALVGAFNALITALFQGNCWKNALFSALIGAGAGAFACAFRVAIDLDSGGAYSALDADDLFGPVLDAVANTVSSFIKPSMMRGLELVDPNIAQAVRCG